MQYLAFYWPDNKTFYIKVTPWPCTKSETCIWRGCKVLRATWRAWNENFFVKKYSKLVESTFEVIVHFGFRSPKNQLFLRLVQYLAFYWPDDKTFYIKVTPWPCTKSDTCIWRGCKVLRASWRAWNESFSVKKYSKLVESTFEVVVHFGFRSSKNQFSYVWENRKKYLKKVEIPTFRTYWRG